MLTRLAETKMELERTYSEEQILSFARAAVPCVTLACRAERRRRWAPVDVDCSVVERFAHDHYSNLEREADEKWRLALLRRFPSLDVV